MKYTVDVIINLPIGRVHQLFDNPENMCQWQPTLQKFELLCGEPNTKGTKSRLLYKMGRRNLEMIETITKNDLPKELVATYETKGVFNIVSNKFTVVNESQTKWVSENEFRFTGLMKFMSFFMKKSFPRETRKFMNHFKMFAESKKGI